MKKYGMIQEKEISEQNTQVCNQLRCVKPTSKLSENNDGLREEKS